MSDIYYKIVLRIRLISGVMTMVCPKCCNTISDSSLFCPFCGEKVGETPKPKETNKHVVEHIDYVPHVRNNPLPNAEKNMYYNQQQNLHEQPAQMYHGTPGYDTMQMYAEYNKKATDLRNFGIVAAILMLGIGFIFSIIVWVGKSSVKAPQIPPQNLLEQNLLEDAQKKLKTANFLAFTPIIASAVCFVLGILLGLTGVVLGAI